MKRHLQQLGMAVFLLGSMAALLWFSVHKPRLLILQSYDLSYSWTSDVRDGLLRVLDKKHYISVRWHYMDTKRHPFPEYRENAAKAARRVIDHWRPDVLVAIDDDAQQYVARHYLNDPDMQIVFAGVNGSVEAYGYDRPDALNVTGIYERSNMRVLRDTLLSLADSLPAERRGGAPLRIMHIADGSESVQKDDAGYRAFDWSPLVLMPSRLVNTWEEWQAAIAYANANADFILTSNYRRLQRSATDKTLMPPQEVAQWTEANAKVPLLGKNGFFVEDGGMLAISTSPYEQGEVAARMALSLLEDPRPAREIPRETSRQYIVYMRGDRLEARALKLPELYEAFARATNNYY